jgi:hypothetical protein
VAGCSLDQRKKQLHDTRMHNTPSGLFEIELYRPFLRRQKTK